MSSEPLIQYDWFLYKKRKRHKYIGEECQVRVEAKPGVVYPQAEQRQARVATNLRN